VRLGNTAEGGSDETTVTTGNSGGSSGDAFGGVTIGTNASAVFDTAQAAQGSLSYRLATGGTSTTVFLQWTFTGVARIFFRAYFRLASVGAARSLIRIRAAGAQVARIALSASDTLELRNGGNSVVDTSTATVSANTWYRIEGDITVGTSQSGTVNLYTGESTTLTEAVTATATYGSGTADEIHYGQVVNASNLANLWLDGLDVNDVGLPGPAVVSAAAECATATMAAQDATSAVAPTADVAAAAVAAQDASAAVSPSAEPVAFTFAAQDATVTTGGGGTSALAECATASVAAQDASSAVSPTADVAAAATAALDPSTAIATAAECADASVAAQDASAAVAPTAETAAATLAAADPSVSVQAHAECAGIGWAAEDPSAAVAVLAEAAAVVAAAYDAVVSTGPVAGTAQLANRTGPDAYAANRSGPDAYAANRTGPTMTGV
jgi:hypothetical protein